MNKNIWSFLVAPGLRERGSTPHKCGDLFIRSARVRRESYAQRAAARGVRRRNRQRPGPRLQYGCTCYTNDNGQRADMVYAQPTAYAQLPVRISYVSF